MKTIDFRFRPNTPDAVDGLIHSPFFGDMCAFFNYPERAWSASLDKIVEIMDEHEITGVITGRDVETTYGLHQHGRSRNDASLPAQVPRHGRA